MNDRQGIISQPKGEKTQQSEVVSSGSLNPCFETTATETFLPERFQLHASEFIDKVYQRWRENGQFQRKSSSFDQNILLQTENQSERNIQSIKNDPLVILDRSQSPGCLNLPASLAPSRLNQKSIKSSFKTKISQEQAKKPVVIQGMRQYHKGSFGNKQFQFVDDSIGFFYNLETANRKLPLKIQELQKQQQLLKKQKEQAIREQLLDSSKKGITQESQQGNTHNNPENISILDNDNTVQLPRSPNQCILKLNEQYCEAINDIKKHQQHDEQLVQKKLKKIKMLKLKQISIMSEQQQQQNSQGQQKRTNVLPENDFTFHIVHPADTKVDLIPQQNKARIGSPKSPTTSISSQKGNIYSQSQDSETILQAQDSYELQNKYQQLRYSHQINDINQKQCRIRLPQLQQNQHRQQKQNKQELFLLNKEKQNEVRWQKKQLLQHELVFEQISQDSINSTPIKPIDCQGFNSQEKVQNIQQQNTQYSKSYSSSPRNNRRRQFPQQNDYYNNNRSNSPSMFSSPKVLSINNSPRVFSSEPREVLRKETGKRTPNRNMKLDTLQKNQNPFNQGFSKESDELFESSQFSTETKIHNSNSMRVTALKQKELLFSAGTSKELENQKRLHQSDKKQQRIKEENNFQQQQQQQHMKISRYESGWECEDKSRLLQKAQQGHLKARLCPTTKELQGRSFCQGNIFDLEGSITRCQVKQVENNNIKVRKRYSQQLQQPQNSEIYSQSKESDENNMNQEQLQLESWNVHPEGLQESVNHLHEYTHK